jgi:hypothetical protein
MVLEKQAKEGFDVRDSMRELSCCYFATYREIRTQSVVGDLAKKDWRFSSTQLGLINENN